MIRKIYWGNEALLFEVRRVSRHHPGRGRVPLFSGLFAGHCVSVSERLLSSNSAIALDDRNWTRCCSSASIGAIGSLRQDRALYCAQQGWQICCNSIHPAAILTPIWEPILGDGPDREARIEALVADTSLRRFGLPEEVAGVALMLASDEAPYMTCTEINIDGGLLAGSAASPG